MFAGATNVTLMYVSWATADGAGGALDAEADAGRLDGGADVGCEVATRGHGLPPAEIRLNGSVDIKNVGSFLGPG